MGEYEFFDHSADAGIRIRANSAEDLFVTAALALMKYIGSPPGGEEVTVGMKVEGDGREELLVHWLQEIHIRFHLNHQYLIAVPKITVDLDLLQIRASVASRVWEDSESHNFQEVKAITYHKLIIEQKGSNWCANVILDI